MKIQYHRLAKLVSILAVLTLSFQAKGRDASGWHLLWSDEFKQANGSAPNPSKWSHEIGGNGWGNNEWEYYTARTNNARIENGKLVIEARKEHFGNRTITSARLTTRGKFTFTFGRAEARIKIPRGPGVWPAFWTLGADIDSRGWPDCGEIDIIENVGKEPATIHGTVHGPGYSGNHGIGGPVTLPGAAAIADDFHVFAVECEPDRIAWFLDNKEYFSVTPASLPKGARWAFDGPKFLLLNLAVGGKWPGPPDANTRFPLKMIVDYVRVYEKAGLARSAQ